MPPDGPALSPGTSGTGGLAHEPAGIPTGRPTSPSRSRLAALALTAGAIAGVASWLAGEPAGTAFRPPLREVQAMGVTMLQADYVDQVAADTKNAALTYGILGALLGLALGLAGGLARGDARSAAAHGLLGLILGGGAGALATLLCAPFYYRMVEKDPLSFDLVLPFLVHSGIGAAVGAASGLAFGAGVNARRFAALGLVGGLLGGVVGAAVYEFAGAVLFPLARTPQPIPATATTRLLAHLAIAACTAAGAWLVVVRSGGKPAPARPMDA